MEQRTPTLRSVAWLWFGISTAVLIIGFRQAIFLVPTDAAQGNVGRIFYYHVPIAMLSLIFPYVNFAASLFYLAIHNQRDAAGLIVFDDEVRNYIRPSTRQGQLHRLLAGLEQAEPHARTDFTKPLMHFQELLHRRGIVIMFSDFYEDPAAVVRTIEPLRYHGNEVVLFHVLDPKELRPELRGPAILVDLETQQRLEVIPEYTRTEYTRKIDDHLEQLRNRTRGAGMDYHLLMTDQPLDGTLREYLAIRQGER